MNLACFAMNAWLLHCRLQRRLPLLPFLAFSADTVRQVLNSILWW